MPRYKTVNNCNLRINLVRIVFLIFPAIFIVRLFSIQVLQHEKYRALAQEQYWNLQEIPAKRGNILSSDGYLLATTQVSYLLYAEPKQIEDKYKVSYELAQVLAEINPFEVENAFNYYQEHINQALSKDLFWVKLQGSLSPEDKKKIEALDLKGIGFEEEPLRYYPENLLASHVLGFVASDENGNKQGYFGVEGSLNGDLRGKPGRIVEERDAIGMPILVGGYRKIDSIDGRDVVLTINRAVQYMVEHKLKEGVEKYGAVSGSVIVMDPGTGDILAMANYPTYDPSNYINDSDIEIDENGRKSVERRNLAISQTYEPGSVIKPLTVAAAIDLKKVTPETTFVDNGPVRYSDYFINNWDGKHHGVQTIIQLLQKSNNIGAAWVGHVVGAKDLSEYFKKFGMGTISGIEMEGEDTGVIRDYKDLTDIDIATIAFGQGMSATPLQVLNSFNVFANGGNLVQPRIISKYIDGDEQIDVPVKVRSKVISSDTAETMNDILTLAVEGGESRYFNIKNYHIAGKTGTAQIPENGKYDPKKTNATFVGYLSKSKKFSMIVKLEEPSSSTYAAETAVPLWMDITRDLVKFYGIPTDMDVEDTPVEVVKVEESSEEGDEDVAIVAEEKPNSDNDSD